MNQPITLLKTQGKNTQENVNKDCIYLAVFLISCDKNFILLLACFGLIFARSLALLSLQFFCHYIAFFSCSARAEWNTESGIFTNILHSKWKYNIRVKNNYVNAMCTTCITVD